MDALRYKKDMERGKRREMKEGSRGRERGDSKGLAP